MNLRARWLRPALTITATLSFLALVTTLLFGSRFGEPRTTGRDSWGRGPLGHHLLHSWLRESGFHTYRQRQPDFSGSAQLWFIEPEKEEVDLEGEAFELVTVIGERSDAARATVLVLPKWVPNPLVDAAEIDEQEVADRLDAIAEACGSYDAPTIHRGPESDTTTKRASGSLGAFDLQVRGLQVARNVLAGDVLLALPNGDALVFRVSNLIVVTDPDLLHNYNFHRGQHADLVYALARRQQGDTVVVDEVFHGHGLRRSLGAALGQFPNWLLVAHLLLLATLVVLSGSRRFGPAEERPPRLGRGPAESIRVAASVLVGSQSVATLGAEYVAKVLIDTARRLGSRGRHLDDAIRTLDAILRRRKQTPEAEGLAVDARELEHRAPRDVTTALSLARRAHRLRKRLLPRNLS